MDYYSRPIRPDELFHHGVKGQKWGLRRFQNPDGTLTAQGRQRYKVDSGPRNVARAVFNTEIGQRLAVRKNKGYREDKKAINEQYKQKAEGKSKEEKKVLKAERKANLNEAKVATADAIFGGQTHAANKVMQTESTGKAIAKSLLMGGFGAKTYNNMRYQNGKTVNRGVAAVTGVLAQAASNYTGGAVGAAEYVTSTRTGAKNSYNRDK